MSFDARLYPVETDANYTVGPAPTVEDVDGFLYPVSNSLDKEGGADGYLSQERLFLEPVAASAGSGAITYVGGQVSSVTGRITDWAVTFALTGGSDSTPQAGDLVLVFYAIGTNELGTPTPSIISPSGYTAGTLLTAVGTGFSTRTNYFYKFMGGTPDTDVTLSQTFDVLDAGAVAIRVYRGVDTTTPIEAVVTSTGTGSSAPNNKPNPASITPTSAGAWIVALGAQGCSTAVDFTAPAELDSGTFQTRIQADSRDIGIGAGHYTGWTSGAYDIGPFGGGASNIANGQSAYTLALKPAAGGGGSSPASATPSPGAVTVAGLAPTSAAAVTTEPTLGAVTVTGFAPTVSTASGASATPDLGAVSVAGLAPTVSAAVAAAPTLGAVTVTGLAPTSAAAATALPTLGAVSVAGFAPTVAAAVTASPTLGAVTVTGLAPTSAAAVTASPTLGAVTVTGFAPSATTGGAVEAVPGTGVVTVAGFASFAAAAASVAPSVGVVSIAGFAPTVTAASGATAAPGTGSVSVAGFAPSVSAGTPIVIVERDDGGEVLKKHIRDKAAAQFKDALEDIREAPKKQRAQAVEAALEALQPIAAGVDYAEGNKALAAISAALGRATIQRDGYLAAVQQAEAEFARLEAIQAKIRKRRRDEAALLLLI